MKAFLRDLAFLALFAATVAAVVLVVAIHQGRFSLEPPEPDSDAPSRSAATMPALAPPSPPPARPDISALSPAAPMIVTPVDIAPRDGPSPARPRVFDPSTRGASGDARVLYLPEITWIQTQLSRWADEGATPRPASPATLEAAHAAARRASAFAYEVSPECWNPPDVVEARGWGDCADKSLWLARELLRAGYTMVGIRLGVPEDYRVGEPGHAWVVLYHHGGEWIYDPAASPRLTSQDAGPTKRFRITATVFPR